MKSCQDRELLGWRFSGWRVVRVESRQDEELSGWRFVRMKSCLDEELTG